MNDLNSAQAPLFKKIDRAVFEQIDKFKQSPNYSGVQDFYNGLDEDQQKIFKAVLNLVLLILPCLFLGFLWWQNTTMKEDLSLRTQTLQKSLEIISQKESLAEVGPRILASNPIDSESMLSSRLGNMLAGTSVDLSRVRTSNFTTELISSGVNRTEADVQFTNLSTDELMNLFTNMIQRERFRIQSVDITRGEDSNLLSGQFHVIHFAAVAPVIEGE